MKIGTLNLLKNHFTYSVYDSSYDALLSSTRTGGQGWAESVKQLSGGSTPQLSSRAEDGSYAWNDPANSISVAPDQVLAKTELQSS